MFDAGSYNQMAIYAPTINGPGSRTIRVNPMKPANTRPQTSQEFDEARHSPEYQSLDALEPHDHNQPDLVSQAENRQKLLYRAGTGTMLSYYGVNSSATLGRPNGYMDLAQGRMKQQRMSKQGRHAASQEDLLSSSAPDNTSECADLEVANFSNKSPNMSNCATKYAYKAYTEGSFV
ncbi:hypothetical protein Ciccas_003565 [Cichlidogyrus casuarinus]|uniref:Uncharacterized protein n=1 Tax=Cichlidogyrus casuarinus TaxID=1844966 RepID=A0ABD2QE13_9PLAT